MSYWGNELRSYVETPFAVEKARRLRAIVNKAEEAGIRAEPDVNDSELLKVSDFRIVDTKILSLAAAAADQAIAEWNLFMETMNEIGRDLCGRLGIDWESYLTEKLKEKR